jgi:hypothetical protein
MAQAGFTPIKLYFSSTTTNVPVAGNLANGELAINITDGKLFYKDNAGVVQVIATKAAAAGVLSFSGGTTGLTPNTATSGAVTLAGTLVVGNGGTGLATLAIGSLPYGAGTSAFGSLAIGTAGQVLTVNSGATAPQYVAQSTLSVGSATTSTNIAGGAAGSVPYNTAAATTAFLSIGTAGQVLTVNSGATAPQYVDQSTLSVGSATTATTATTATNVAGGAAGSVPYNTAAATTAFLSIGTAGQVLVVNSGATAPEYVAQSTLSVGTAVTAGTATNLAGGAANRVAYQSGVGSTTFVAAPTVTSTFLQWNGSAIVWAAATGSTANALTIGTGLSGTSFDGSAAVTIAIDSTVATLTGTQTLTNKRIEPRVFATTTNTSITPDLNDYDQYSYTALASSFTVNAPSNPSDGIKLTLSFTDNGTARGLTFNAIFRAIGVTIPTSTVPNKTVYIGCIYNSTAVKWDVVAVAQQV